MLVGELARNLVGLGVVRGVDMRDVADPARSEAGHHQKVAAGPRRVLVAGDFHVPAQDSCERPHLAVRPLLKAPLDGALVGVVEGRKRLPGRRLVGGLAAEAHEHALVTGRQEYRDAFVAAATPGPVVLHVAPGRKAESRTSARAWPIATSVNAITAASRHRLGMREPSLQSVTSLVGRRTGRVQAGHSAGGGSPLARQAARSVFTSRQAIVIGP